MVTAICATLVGGGACLLASRRVHPPAPPPAPAGADEARAPRRSSSRADFDVYGPAAPPRLRRPAALAHLRGQVRPPPGRPHAFDDLEVIADDGARRLAATSNDRGEFELHLPARPFTLVARAGSLVGSAKVRPTAGAVTETIIELGETVSIEGVVHAPAQAFEDLVVVATEVGSATGPLDQPSAPEGTFAIDGLIPGVRYEVTVRAAGFRAVTLRDVEAPATGLEVTLTASPVLHGAIGFPTGAPCPFEVVEVRAADRPPPDDDDDADADSGGDTVAVDEDCRFQVDDLPEAPDLEVRATGPGWHAEERITVPAEGDPPFLCLNPPCPAAGPARPRASSSRLAARVR